MGKFVIRNVDSGMKFDLRASNGQVVATSEVYTTRDACEKGIASVRKNAPAARLEDQTEDGGKPVSNPKFELYLDRAGQYRFRLKARNGQVIAISEGYKIKSGCLNGIESVQNNASGAEVVEELRGPW